MNEQIKKAITEGRVILFLGAGASIGSENSQGNNPPLGLELAKTIASKVGWTYQDEPLSVVYSAAKNEIGSELDVLLTKLYKHCKPSESYKTIAKFPWPRIYTTNIDDAMECALNQHSKQKVNVKNRNDRIEDKDQLFRRVEYIYLNGSIKTPDQGFVFSAEEYGKASAIQPKWYEEVASDFLQCVFIFIGTNLSEPVFYHQAERYKERAGISAPLSYVFSPTATPIQIAGFDSYGLRHIQATLDDFCYWLLSELPIIPSPTDIAQNRIPELRSFLAKKSEKEKLDYAALLKDVVVVSRQTLAQDTEALTSGTIRPFYKGFKPTWRDVIDNVPAELSQLSIILEKLKDTTPTENNLFAIVGPAGSGKSTLLKMLALALSDAGNKVYFLEIGSSNLPRVIRELESLNTEKYYIFFERFDPIKEDIKRVTTTVRRGIFVGAESQNIWHNRVASAFGSILTSVQELKEISETDVQPILDKIRSYGPWTRLSNLSPRQRKRELYDKSKRQLLIGLMETITGIGFEQIIVKDFESVVSNNDRLFFVLVCIATLHRTNLSISMAARTLSNLAVSEPPIVVSSRLRGIVEIRNERFVARHPLYARKIIESVIDQELIVAAITALLQAFTVYPHPVVKSLDKNDATLFKSVINHNFLADVLRGDQRVIFSIYTQFEKPFENDGLFWLQYGLSKRTFGYNIDAFEILQTAYNAYPSDHTTHALAQQNMIFGGEF